MKSGFNKAAKGNKIIIEKQFGELEISQIKSMLSALKLLFTEANTKIWIF